MLLMLCTFMSVRLLKQFSLEFRAWPLGGRTQVFPVRVLEAMSFMLGKQKNVVRQEQTQLRGQHLSLGNQSTSGGFRKAVGKWLSIQVHVAVSADRGPTRDKKDYGARQRAECADDAGAKSDSFRGQCG